MSDDRSRPPDGEATRPTPDAAEAERAATFSRRALIQAGWTAPVLVVATVPVNAYAQSVHRDEGHQDQGHQDQPVHTDAGHIDSHDDTHSDVPHVDQHGDERLGAPDHSDFHFDLPHTDVPHVDSHGDEAASLRRRR
jgi:hypothetical protein